MWDLISHSWFSPDHVLQRQKKRRLVFSLIFPTFYSLLSILKVTVKFQETNSLRAISLQTITGDPEGGKKK